MCACGGVEVKERVYNMTYMYSRRTGRTGGVRACGGESI